MWRQALFPLAVLLGLLLPPASCLAERPEGPVDGIYVPVTVSAQVPVVAEIEDSSLHLGCHLTFLPTPAKRSATVLDSTPKGRRWAPATSLLLRLIGRQNE